jgi:hypothetical protein
MKKLFLMAALTVPSISHAGELWLTSGEVSRHVNESKHNYRQNNSGVGLEYDENENLSYVAGWYNNSIHRETIYVGGTYAPIHLGGLKLGAMGAIATGYTQSLPAVPIASLYGSYEYERVGVNLYWLPTVVVAAQLKIKF